MESVPTACAEGAPSSPARPAKRVVLLRPRRDREVIHALSPHCQAIASAWLATC